MAKAKTLFGGFGFGDHWWGAGTGREASQFGMSKGEGIPGDIHEFVPGWQNDLR